MFFLTLFFTSVVSAVKAVNDEKIRLNEEIRFKAVVLDVLGMPLEAAGVMETFDRRVRKRPSGDRTVYVGYGPDGETVTGYAFPAGGPGFWGPIEAMAAVDRDAGSIIGVNFYRNAETPGLGARITEDWFRDQFRALPLGERDRDKPFFRLVQPGTATDPGELDAVTGATGTSRAVETFLNREIHSFLETFGENATEGR